jgi:hypothetical protein
MKRIVLMVTVALVMALMMAVGGPASATIHPIVESYDCANDKAFENHPLNDPADPPGQTPGDENPAGEQTGQGNNEFRALQESDEQAAFGHKLDGKCGKVGQ